MKKFFTILIVMIMAGRTFAGDLEPVDSPLLKKYGTFCKATYQTGKEVRRLGEAQHYTLSQNGNIPQMKVSYFLLTNNESRKQVIAVRGTSNMENALVDIALKLKMNEKVGIRLHTGFSQAAEKIYQQIQPLLKPGYAISTTGHSLGGAVALILAMYLDVDDYDISRVVTFGQPKVTNIAGAGKFDHLSVTRVVMPRDLVPLVPPLDAMDINDLDIYWHLGKEVILLENIDYAVLEGLNSMLRATRFTQEQLTKKNLRHHQITEYLTMLDKKIPEAKQVSYENSFNLFNLFDDAPQSEN